MPGADPRSIEVLHPHEPAAAGRPRRQPGRGAPCGRCPRWRGPVGLGAKRPRYGMAEAPQVREWRARPSTDIPGTTSHSSSVTACPVKLASSSRSSPSAPPPTGAWARSPTWSPSPAGPPGPASGWSRCSRSTRCREASRAPTARSRPSPSTRSTWRSRRSTTSHAAGGLDALSAGRPDAPGRGARRAGGPLGRRCASSRGAPWRRPSPSFVEREWRPKTARARELERFAREQSAWLDDYALFVSIHDELMEGRSWLDWPEPLRDRRAGGAGRRPRPGSRSGSSSGPGSSGWWTASGTPPGAAPTRWRWSWPATSPSWWRPTRPTSGPGARTSGSTPGSACRPTPSAPPARTGGCRSTAGPTWRRAATSGSTPAPTGWPTSTASTGSTTWWGSTGPTTS